MNKFSIIITCFNQSQKIISNVLNMLDYLQLVDFIIIDDCSTDNSFDLLNLQFANNKNIYIYKTAKNSGPHIARKKGVENSHSEWILFLDGDDKFLPNVTTTLDDYIKCNSNIKIFEFGYIEKFSKTEKIFKQETLSRFDCYVSTTNRINQTIWNKAYKSEVLKEAFNKMENINAKIGEDYYEQLIISSLWKFPYKNIPEVLYEYSDENGISTTKLVASYNKNRFRDLKEVNIYILKYLESYETVNETIQKNINYNCYHDCIRFCERFSKNKFHKAFSYIFLVKYYPFTILRILYIINPIRFFIYLLKLIGFRRK